MRLVRIGHHCIAEHLHPPDHRIGEWPGVRVALICYGYRFNQDTLNLLESGLLVGRQRIAPGIAIGSGEYHNN